MVTLHSQGESLYDVSSAVHNTAFKHYKLAVYFMTLIELNFTYEKYMSKTIMSALAHCTSHEYSFYYNK